MSEFKQGLSHLLYGSIQEKLELVFWILQRGQSQSDELTEEDSLLVLWELSIASGYLISGAHSYEARS